MLEPRCQADLTLETLGPHGRCQLGTQHLQRDPAVVPEIVGEIHRGHATLPQFALEPVSVCQAALELVAEVYHAGLL